MYSRRKELIIKQLMELEAITIEINPHYSQAEKEEKFKCMVEAGMEYLDKDTEKL